MAVALILFDQGGPGTAGQAFEGTVSGGLVTVTNGGDNTGVISWEVELLDTPAGSAVATGVIGAALTATPSATFTPDVSGSYRVQLTVNEASSSDVDIRNFGIRNGRGIIVPPYQKDPDPLPLPYTLEPTAKPDEQNYGGQDRGWAGGETDGLLTQHFLTHGDLPFATATASPITLSIDDPPLTIVNLDAVGGNASLILPLDARAGQVIEVFAAGASTGRVITVAAPGGGSIAPTAANTISLSQKGTYVCLGSNNWRAWVPALRTDLLWDVTSSTTGSVTLTSPDANRTVLHLADSSGGAYTINLPASPNSGDRFTIKDSTGSAAAEPVTVSGNGNDIDGSGAFVLANDYGSVSVYFDGSSWLVT